MTGPANGSPPRAGRLGVPDILRLGAVGLRAHPLRACLSALGIAIGIAAMLAVVGISTSGRAHLDRELARLGTNLLTVAPGTTADGGPAQLPATSVSMIGRIAPVQSVSAIGMLDSAVYRTGYVPPGETGSIAVAAAEADLPQTIGARLRSGSWPTGTYPTVVLGSIAAERLAVPRLGMRVLLGGQWFAVAGVLAPVPLAPDLDSTALIGWGTAQRFLHFNGRPTMVYTRIRDSQVEAVQAVLARTANPESPSEVRVSRPSDALAAQRATASTLNGLLLGLGAVAILVGGVGVANTMVISVLERRGEVGLRRALGATRRQVRGQFLTESLLLSLLGGGAGCVLGAAVVTLYAVVQHWPVVVPLWACAAGLAATVLVGALAGLYPAVRASRLPPTEALATP